MLRELTEEGHEVSMQITGNSMSPFLENGRDRICFCKPKQPFKKGDMVFFQRENGQYVMHRICKVKAKTDPVIGDRKAKTATYSVVEGRTRRSEEYYLIGDGQTDVEGPIRAEQIFAIVTKVQRKGKWIGPGAFWWEFFAHVWIHMIPVRRVVMSCYGKIHVSN